MGLGLSGLAGTWASSPRACLALLPAGPFSVLLQHGPPHGHPLRHYMAPSQPTHRLDPSRVLISQSAGELSVGGAGSCIVSGCAWEARAEVGAGPRKGSGAQSIKNKSRRQGQTLGCYDATWDTCISHQSAWV